LFRLLALYLKRSLTETTRADFTFIAGGIVPGILVLKPDFQENKEDWPFFWGENEVTVGGCADYIFLSTAAQQLLTDK
jgi:endoglucanase